MFLAGCLCLAASSALAQNQVTVEWKKTDEASAAFAFKTVPHPSTTDAATKAKFSLAEGEADSNGGDLDKLHDGKLPEEEDQPGENFFFNAGSDGGRIVVDLGHDINVKQVNTYSWHPNTRAAQVYKLYAAEGKDIKAAPKWGGEASGWKLIATVNTRAKGEDSGGQYGVSIANTNGALGKYRFLLFDVSATERDDDFGQTFYSELDVIDADGGTASAATEAAPDEFVVKTADDKCTITINTAKAPQLKEWAKTKLAPALIEWYPKIVAELPSEGYTAPDHFKVTLKPMNGVAYTAGQNVVANSDWLEKELDGEAVGSLVHEAVHVVQHYGYSRDFPGWMVEAIPDYIRWFQFDADKHGADLVWMKKRGKNFKPKYDASYRVSANFLDWVTHTYDKEIVTKMNAAMRTGNYDEALWKKLTGKALSELGEEWAKQLTAQIAG